MSASLPLPPSTIVPTNGITLAENSNLAGTVIVDDIVPFSYFGSFPVSGKQFVNSGQVQTRIVKRASGALDFYWRVFSDNNSGTPLQGIVVLSFGNISDIFHFNYRIDGVGNVPTAHASRNPDVIYGFGFQGMDLPPGQSSNFFFAETNVFLYTKSSSFQIYDAYTESGFYQCYGPKHIHLPIRRVLTP